jgi:hypothetical protein
MTTYNVRLSFVDRRQGPGTGRSLSVDGSNLPIAISKAVRIFWRELGRKQRNDARRGGIKIEAFSPVPVIGGTLTVPTIRKTKQQLEAQ